MSKDIFSYAQDYLNISFEEVEFGEIDYLLFSQIAHVDFSLIESGKSLTLAEAGDKYFNGGIDRPNYIGLIIPRTIVPLFRIMYNSNRYGNVVVSDYIDQLDRELESHISAATFTFPNQDKCVVFCGTGDYIISWKENFKLLFQFPLDGQISAEKYLKSVIENKAKNAKLIVIGHSKGGNFALYSAVKNADTILPYIKQIYNIDGPGFKAEFYLEEEYKKIKNFTTTFVPNGSIIGRLFEHSPNETKYIESTVLGLFQHDCFSWVLKNDKLSTLESLDETAQAISDQIKLIINKYSEEEKKDFVTGIFMLFELTNEETLTGLIGKRQEIMKNYFKLGKKERKAVNRILLEFIKDKNLRVMIMTAIKETPGYFENDKKVS